MSIFKCVNIPIHGEWWKIETFYRSPWKALPKEYPNFLNHIALEMGDGKDNVSGRIKGGVIFCVGNSPICTYYAFLGMFQFFPA